MVITGVACSNFPKDRNEQLLEEYKDTEWKPWQQDVLCELDKDPDPRKVSWYWEPDGNAGKSYLTRYLVLKHQVIIACGKKADVFHQVLTFCQKHPHSLGPRVVILDIPRSGREWINYGILESLKDGVLYSGKYEGGQVVIARPHVVCFANFPPDEMAMSQDRWSVTQISKPL